MEKQTGRLEAFSDGIFGVAITLLAIEIGISEYDNATNTNLWERIVEKWPEYFAYFNSFATVLLIWMGHHKIFSKIWKANHWIMLVNGLALLCIVLFPYPTRLVGNFIGTNAQNTAIAFYAGFTGLIVLAMFLLNLSILTHKKYIIHPEKNLAFFQSQSKLQLLAIGVYAVATFLAFYSPTIAIGITFLMWVFWAFVTKDTENEE
jgi:uncharacterized membrane protein